MLPLLQYLFWSSWHSPLQECLAFSNPECCPLLVKPSLPTPVTTGKPAQTTSVLIYIRDNSVSSCPKTSKLNTDPWAPPDCVSRAAVGRTWLPSQSRSGEPRSGEPVSLSLALSVSLSVHSVTGRRRLSHRRAPRQLRLTSRASIPLQSPAATTSKGRRVVLDSLQAAKKALPRSWGTSTLPPAIDLPSLRLHSSALLSIYLHPRLLPVWRRLLAEDPSIASVCDQYVGPHYREHK